MVISFYISARSVWEFQLLYILANIWHCSTGYLVVLIFVSRCLVMLSIFSCVYCLFFGEVSLYIFCLYVVRSVLLQIYGSYMFWRLQIYFPGMCVYVHVHIQLCLFAWLYRQAPLSMEFSRQEYWNRLLYLSPGDLPYSGVELASLVSGSFPAEQPRELFPSIVTCIFTFLIVSFKISFNFDEVQLLIHPALYWHSFSSLW